MKNEKNYTNNFVRSSYRCSRCFGGMGNVTLSVSGKLNNGNHQAHKE